MSLARPLVQLKREITEKKWANAQRWAGGRTSKKRCIRNAEELEAGQYGG